MSSSEHLASVRSLKCGSGYKTTMAKSIVVDELKCGICLELFQDPRSLPCLHTFCLECLQRLLNKNHSLKCPVCRAKHELSKEGAELL